MFLIIIGPTTHEYTQTKDTRNVDKEHENGKTVVVNSNIPSIRQTDREESGSLNERQTVDHGQHFTYLLHSCKKSYQRFLWDTTQ